MSGGSAPRWPRDRWISPSALATYRICPYKVRLQHIDRIAPPYRYNVHLNKGRIAHVILKRIADAVASDRPPIDEAEMAKMARLHLPWQVFPSRKEHEMHARQVVRWAEAGRRYLERVPEASYLLVERNLNREWRILAAESPYTIMARPDVVLLRPDADGAPLIEIIDYKTGKVRPDPEPPVLMCFVFRELLARHAGDPSTARVRFTYLWLDAAEKTQIDLTLEHCHERWEPITQTLRDFAAETDWTARPSRLCRFCPYFQNACAQEMPPG
jgi:RecB family exonuclease